MSNESIITEAIHSMSSVIGINLDHPRVFSPYAIGYKSTEDHGPILHTHGWQSGGGSDTGLLAGGEWQCFEVAKFSDLALSSIPFTPLPGTMNPQPCVDADRVTAAVPGYH